MSCTAYDLGFNAFLDMKCSSDCPFETSDPRSEEWAKGFSFSKELLDNALNPKPVKQVLVKSSDVTCWGSTIISIWDCHIDKSNVIKKGSLVSMEYLWGWKKDREKMDWPTTEAFDLTIKLEADCTLQEALALLESYASQHIKRDGGIGLRQYYIEKVEINKGIVLYDWGT